MKKLGFIIPLFLTFFLFSCNTRDNGDSSAPNQNGTEETAELEGYTIEGEPSSCRPMPPDRVCTEIFTEQDQFAIDCKNQGHQAIQCDCHEFLCSERI